jgi:hypothetical protein
MRSAAALVFALIAFGCSTLLGLDEYRDKPDTGAGAMGGAGGGGVGGGGSGGADSGGAGAVEAGGEAGADGDADPGATFLGRACDGDGDCGGVLTCWRPGPNALGGAPARGYCTTDCDSCKEHGGQRCHEDASGASHCLLGCTPGPEGIEWNPTKCHGRPELACLPWSATEIVCVPQCNSDADCEGFWCNPGNGLCQAEPPTGWAHGSECSISDAGVDECLGFCLTLVQPRWCSGRCTIGVEATCGWEPASGLPARHVCGMIFPGAGPGDFGVCTPLCECDADCPNATYRCQPFSNPELEDKYKMKGYCAEQGQGIPCQ